MDTGLQEQVCLYCQSQALNKLEYFLHSIISYLILPMLGRLISRDPDIDK